MANKDFKRTQFAKLGIDFSTLFAAKFGRSRVSGHQPILQEPPGVSTEGGRQATQHVLLRPEQPAAPTLTIGSVNLVMKTATLRTFGCLEQMHRLRYPKRRFPLDVAAYQAFLDPCAAFFQQHGMALGWESQAPVEPVALGPVSVAGRSSAAAWVLVVLIVLVLAGGVVGFLFWRGLI
ncbi:MAG: hypothetical protein HY908_36155 [Myxococcales bacterium]|nr:hypothetical protein [Myxococcales bacterium]